MLNVILREYFLLSQYLFNNEFEKISPANIFVGTVFSQISAYLVWLIGNIQKSDKGNRTQSL